MQYWLVKTEPETYSFEDLKKEGVALWDGVRNYAARKHMQNMRKGDLVLVYHSGKSREIVGLTELVQEAFPDPTTSDDRWLAVKLKALKTFNFPIDLAWIKSQNNWSDWELIKQSRLSVMPVPEDIMKRLQEIGENGQ